ncbi:MAG TPA: alpha/beta hydrolase [Gemmatimonadales bacterium]|nr:alpha/beta hydrolase [Gemmatimonadales bacterium]
MIALKNRASAALVLLTAVSCSPRSGERSDTGQIETASSTASPAAEPRTSPAAPDQEMQAVLTQLEALHPKPIPQLSAAEARKQPTPADAVKALLRKEGKSTAPEPVGKVTNRTVPGAGGPIPIRIYTPKGSGPFPVIVYYHGGGWVIADLDTYDASPRALANLANAIVVSSHYRQGPEHKFPAAHQDAFTAYRWALANAKSLGGDPSKVAVVGESAGGGLATAVSMMARDSGAQMPVHQVLVYPIAGYDLNTPSYQENAEARPLNKAMMAWFFDQYLRSPADGKNPLIDLVNADLKGLPAATVITAQIDPLRSEGKTLADRLETAGVDVDYKNYEGATHEFFGMGAVLDDAKAAQQQAADGLKKGFGRRTTASQQ